MKQWGVKCVLLAFQSFGGARNSEWLSETMKRNSLIFKNFVSVGDVSLCAGSHTN